VVEPGSQMSVSSLHNPFFLRGDYATNVSHSVDAEGAIKTELQFSGTFQANMVSQRSNSSGSLEINGNTFSVLSEGHRDDGTYFVSVSGFVGNYSWVEYSSPTNMDGLSSGNSLSVSFFEPVPQSSSAMAKSRVYFEEGWASIQASSAVRGNDQFDYAGHSIAVLGEGIDDAGEYYIEVRGSFQKGEGEDFWLNMVNRPRESFGYNGSDVDSVSYASKAGSDLIISSVTLNSSGNTASLSYAINQTSSIVTQDREFSVLGQSVNQSGQLVLQIDGYIDPSAHIHPEALISQRLPTVSGFGHPINVSYSTLNDGTITSKLELGAGSDAQRADFVGDKYGKILIDGLPFQIIEEGLEDNGHFSITVEGYAQADRHLGYVYDDHQSSNNWFGHLEASHHIDARGEVISRINASGDDHQKRGFAHATLSGTLVSQGYKLNVIGQGIDENGRFYADIDGFVQDGSDAHSTSSNPDWKQRNHLGNSNQISYSQTNNSVHSTITFQDTNDIQRVAYYAEKDGSISLDELEYQVVGGSLESDGSYRLTIEGFVSGEAQVRSNSYAMTSQKVHFDVASITHGSDADEGITSTIKLSEHVNADEINQYVERDGEIVSDGLRYEVLDNGVDDSGQSYLLVSGYVSSNNSIGTLSDIGAADEAFNQTNLQVGHVENVEVLTSQGIETTRLFFHSEHDGQLASQFAQQGIKVFVDQQQFEVLGAGLEAGSYYVEVEGVATTGQMWMSSDPASEPQNNWLGHPQGVTHQVNQDGLVTTSLTFNQHDAQRVSMSVSTGDRIYNDMRGAGYKVLQSGVSGGEFFVEVEGYISGDNGLSTWSNLDVKANEHIAQVHEGNAELLVSVDGVVRSKLLITENVQELAKSVESGEQLFLDNQKMIVDSMSVEEGELYLVVEGMISSGGIQRHSEFVETTFVDLQNNASDTIKGVTVAMEKISEQIAGYGASQNRLSFSVSNLMTVAEQTESARSRIEDADFAAESARLAKAQVLQQSGAAMLAQANASSQLTLSLIR
ncbi:flagellin, partial [Gammaproteobacteria bacterium]|nr:flagellin [Gammaproteobacteria bacterium]